MQYNWYRLAQEKVFYIMYKKEGTLTVERILESKKPDEIL